MSPREQLWELAYLTFEKRPGSGFRTGFSSQGMSNEVQFRLMKNIAKLREDIGLVDKKLIGSIVADILVAEAMVWMSQETSQSMQDIIDEISGEKK